MNHCKEDNEDDNSPLKRFTVAKQSLIGTFNDLDYFCHELCGFLAGISSLNVPIQFDSSIEDTPDRIKAILRIISRNHMKVVFFGRTSNGKSKVINAMLRDEILPSGLGHTTNCFLQIEGYDGDESFFTFGDSNQKHPIQTLDKYNGYHSEHKLKSTELIKISWPRSKCSFLKDDIVMIDSPGFDISPDMDSVICEHCTDADVFVLVNNSEGVLSGSEKKFFFSVRKTLSNPNIFILNNRWDVTADEADGGKMLRKLHENAQIKFLCNEMNICKNADEATNRIYFVSAKETLNERRGLNTTIHLANCEERTKEFAYFEHELTECLSKSAIKTKFKPHTEQGVMICQDLKLLLDNMFTNIKAYRGVVADRYEACSSQVQNIEDGLRALTASIKNSIREVTDTVEAEVCVTLEQEIERLQHLVDQFQRPFVSDDEQLDWYKRELNRYVETKLGESISSRLRQVVLNTMERVQFQIRDEILNLIPQSKADEAKSISTRTDFSAAYSIDCLRLCSDFKEDISFKFSLAPSAILAKVAQMFSSHDSTTADDTQVSTSRFEVNNNASSTTQQMSTESVILSLKALNALSSTNSMIVVFTSAVVWRGVGWKAIAIAASFFGMYFVCERLMWTKKAQERAYKRQYVDFASQKLRLVTGFTSGNAGQQVQHELSLYFAQMCRFADQSRDELMDEMTKLEDEQKSVNSVHNRTAKLREKAGQLLSSLLQFTREFIDPCAM